MAKKPYKIKQLENPQDTELLDNLLTILFNTKEDEEKKYRSYTGAGVWPAADTLAEKQIYICENTTDAEVRIYTKVRGNLKYIALT